MIGPETIIDQRYRVLSRLGSGGMAEVYLAEDQLLGRQVALKVLHHHFAADQEFVERFRREASSAAALSHPGIVAIFDRGEWDGTYYIAMEYVAGRSLKALVREQGALDPARAIEIVIQILRAARFAHKRGVIHRDLKPHNVILDDDGRARVTDFGIARAGASDMTLTGSIMGTAQYLSPEQAQGFAVSSASDLYSVGVILYELLTGVVPFEGDSAVAIAFKQVSAAPRPPSELNPAIPPSLDAVVLRALAKDPTERFGSADELILALERERAALPAYSGVTQAATVAVPPPVRPLGAAVLMAPATGPHEVLAAAPEQEPANRWWWWALGGVLAAVAVALAILLLLRPASTIGVPAVGGETESAAIAAISHVGLTPVPSLASSGSVPPGHVVAQSPAAGTAVRRGARVAIAISSGPAISDVPTVEGLSSQAAEKRLRSAGFKPATKQEASSGVAAGHVISSSPGAGDAIRTGSTVTLLVSSGPAPVKVPDLQGQTRAAAAASLEAAGLALGAVAQKQDQAATAGTVIAQTPASGTSLRAGEKVSITLAKASDEVAVPSVVGETEAEAAARLGAAGLKPSPQPAATGEQSQAGTVLSQHPAAGQRVRKGSAVTIGIGTLSSATTTTPAPPSTTPAAAPPAPGSG